MFAAPRISALYRRLGRKPPTPGPAKQRPPSARGDMVQYRRRMVAFWSLWRDHVDHIARSSVRSDSIRTDATDPAPALRLAFDDLFRASGLTQFLARMTKRLSDKVGKYTATVTRLPLTQIATQRTIESFRQKNVALITKLRDEHIQEIADILRPAQAAGTHFEDIASQIQDRLGVGESRARLIARDQVGKLNADLHQEHQTGAGITQYRWSTSKDSGVRGDPDGIYAKSQSDHFHLEGTLQSWAEPPITNPVTGETNHPGQDIQCRCVAIPVIPFLET